MKNINQLKQFREQVYQGLGHYADAQMELLDAMCSQTRARSVVELSLEPVFRRAYHSVYRAIDSWSDTGRSERLRVVGKTIPEPEREPYWLFGTDTTSVRRQFAQTLEDRGFVYHANPIKGNKPVTIGHRYSILAHLPEKAPGTPPWLVPLLVERVSTQQTEGEVGVEQLRQLMEDKDLPWHAELCVHVGDTRYSTPDYLVASALYPNLVTISRLRSNRKLYRPPPPVMGKSPPGHPSWYGTVFKLNDPTTWHEPDEVVEFEHINRRGGIYTVRVEAWNDMLMRGTKTVPMHCHPFRLVRIIWLDEEGKPIFKRPIWLVVFGRRRHDLSLSRIQHAYAQRFDLEHFFRFGKQQLLLTSFQTPDVQREENWWQMVLLAYTQLWLVRGLVHQLPHPWERYLPSGESDIASPAQAQRGFQRVIQQFGTPVPLPKLRGYSPGRAPGSCLPPRKRIPVVKKAT